MLSAVRCPFTHTLLFRWEDFMGKLKLRAKLVIGAVAMVVFILLVSTAIVTFTVIRQNKEVARKSIKNTFKIILSDLSRQEKGVLHLVEGMASNPRIGGNIEFIREYKKKKAKGYTKDLIRKLNRDMILGLYSQGQANDIVQACVYDKEGDLTAFVEFRKGRVILGYPVQMEKKRVYRIASISPGARLSSKDWKIADALPIRELFQIGVLRDLGRPMVTYEKSEGSLFLCSYAPILDKVSTKKGEGDSSHPVGIVAVGRKLSGEFARMISGFTDVDVNIFTGNKLSAGTLPAYNTLREESYGRESERFSLNGTEVFLGNVKVGKNQYLRGILPLGAGAVAALYSYDIVWSNTWQMIRRLVLIALICILVTLPCAILFSESVARPVRRILESLLLGSDRVASASREITTNSQALATDSSMQASSLEETSSSLEEMSSMTRKNADHSLEADRLSKESIENLKTANHSMKSLMSTMEETSSASKDVGKIIKTIDEIAFQTNLLALNAAVEAARAGEAGAGFAVVADEVRNLALRSAKASKDTQRLVEGIVAKIGAGSELVRETDDRYREVALSVQKVTELVAQISSGTREQAQGIEQINKAVQEMDEAIQRNAARAEESASSSTEMQAEAENMKEMVEKLAEIIVGRKGESSGEVLSLSNPRLSNGQSNGPAETIEEE
ncbi:MAG: hypothetical protein JRH13_05825 [Deltaproteobacteria bacterium]|nr:hypothetical protein [Deltaproteobacteria bacterium]MBW2128864.1 hypothetical protein [Deltaproteobacteria bacterium]MBW2304451.1 hypothetical protein [Deltaproteobacteria bacterium]